MLLTARVGMMGWLLNIWFIVCRNGAPTLVSVSILLAIPAGIMYSVSKLFAPGKGLRQLLMRRGVARDGVSVRKLCKEMQA